MSGVRKVVGVQGEHDRAREVAHRRTAVPVQNVRQEVRESERTQETRDHKARVPEVRAEPGSSSRGAA